MTNANNKSIISPQIRKQLAGERIVWLTTVSADGTPQPNPVWFIPDGNDVIVYSLTKAARVRNIRRHPQVSLNFNASFEGGDVGVMTGSATIDDSIPAPHENADYMAKYRGDMQGVGLTPEQFSETYSVPIRITPVKARGT